MILPKEWSRIASERKVRIGDSRWRGKCYPLEAVREHKSTKQRKDIFCKMEAISKAVGGVLLGFYF